MKGTEPRQDRAQDAPRAAQGNNKDANARQTLATGQAPQAATEGQAQDALEAMSDATLSAPSGREQQIAAEKPFEHRPALDTGDLEVAVPVERTENQRAGDAKITRMGTDSTLKLLLEFSVPAVVGVLVQTLYNVIDAMYVGAAVGADGLAATTVANPAMTFMVAIAMLVGVGGNALAAIKLGERKKRVAERVLGNSFVLLLVAGVIVWIVGLVALDPILRASGADDVVLPHAHAFMIVIVAGCPLQFIAFGMNNFIRTAGHPNRALGSMLIGTGANVVLGYLFVMVLDGGMTGAALATVCSWALSAAFVMQFFLARKSPMPLRRVSLGIKAKVALRICALGVAPAVMELGFAVSNMIMNNLLMSFGAHDALGSDGALAVMRVLSAVGLFTIMPSMGIAMGAQPIIGYNYGARNFGRMKRTLGQAIVLGVAITTPLWLSVLFLPDMYSHMFSLPAEYLDITAWALVAYLVFIPIIPVSLIGSNYFDATGQAFKATVLTLTRQILFFIPLLLSAPYILPGLLGITPLQSLFLAPSISDITSILVVLTFLAFEWRRLRKLELGEQRAVAQQVGELETGER
ncbi:MAG: MATE family efflux transporter [Gordonibacter sp.]|uniref:MATE family efflux transporter n=1 Tax=Gordonibacter sp. TaxID=1968902 RepID=UPI002FCAD9F9